VRVGRIIAAYNKPRHLPAAREEAMVKKDRPKKTKKLARQLIKKAEKQKKKSNVGIEKREEGTTDVPPPSPFSS
jgi:hypothetical protein